MAFINHDKISFRHKLSTMQCIDARDLNSRVRSNAPMTGHKNAVFDALTK
jgi:hypothetical protein